MEKIKSFEIDHTTLKRGIYLSRTDGDIITLDIRMRAPYIDKVLTNTELHSIEHLIATFMRNGSQKDKVIYFGPMGCQTGFYALLRDLDFETGKNYVKQCLLTAKDYCGKMPGNSKTECGHHYTLSLKKAKTTISEFLNSIK